MRQSTNCPEECTLRHMILDVVVKFGILLFHGFIIVFFDRDTFWFFGANGTSAQQNGLHEKKSPPHPQSGGKALWARKGASCSRGRKPANWKLAKSRGHSTPQKV